ncbi:MAG: hypothetical protein KME57_19535 [Scytonema hyalinum WJT4-NPBG1]|jgi:hypothetical protein|nr:hypothetical protein [Scytonema hyalinum WJT4-NPBG1]
MRTGESSPEGGFPAVGNWRSRSVSGGLTRRGEKYQFVIARTKVQRTHYTVLSSPKAVMVQKCKAVLQGRGFYPNFR